MTVLKHCHGATSPVELSARENQDPLSRHRESMRRFMSAYQSLPWATQATCPVCFDQVPAEFKHPDENSSQVILEYQCPECGFLKEVHHDAIWSETEPDRPRSAVRTHSGSTIKPNMRLLPRTVETLCPECAAVIVGRYFVEDDMVLIEKTCPDHNLRQPG